MSKNTTELTFAQKFYTSGTKRFLCVGTLMLLSTSIMAWSVNTPEHNLGNVILIIAFGMLTYMGYFNGALTLWIKRRYFIMRIPKPDYTDYLLTEDFSSKTDRYYRARLKKYTGGQYVYLVKDASASGYFKIGRTDNPYRRLSRFDVILPFKMHIIAIYPCEDAAALEASLHRRFKDIRMDGEWFRMTGQCIEYMIEMDTNFQAGYPGRDW